MAVLKEQQEEMIEEQEDVIEKALEELERNFPPVGEHGSQLS